MSCWRKYQSKALKNVERRFLKEACEELGFSLDFNVNEIAAYGNSANVTCALKQNSNILSLGFILKENENGDTELTLEGDFWGTGLNESSFLNKLAQTYQKIRIQTELEEKGFSIESISTNEKEEIELVACC